MGEVFAINDRNGGKVFVIQSEAKNLVYIHVYALEILRFTLFRSE